MTMIKLKKMGTGVRKKFGKRSFKKLIKTKQNK
jgi:hypothetical protein